MYREKITEMVKKLKTAEPYSGKVSGEIRQLDRMDSIYSTMRLEGYDVDREEVLRICGGELLDHVSIKAYSLAENCRKAADYLESCMDLSSVLDEKIIRELNDILSGGQHSYRKDTPVLGEYDFTPVMGAYGERDLTKAITEIKKRKAEDPILTAACVHCEIIRIFPFKYMNRTTARFAMNYQLKTAGFHPVVLGVSRQEYSEMIKSYLKTGDIIDFYKMLEKAVYNKLTVLCQMIY